MKQIAAIIIGCFLYCAAFAASQELPTSPIGANALIKEQLGAIKYPTGKIGGDVDEITIGRLQIARLREQIYNSGQTPRSKAEKRRDQETQYKLWRAAIGNTAVTNWSPYPDRMLDARTLSFPMRGVPRP